MDNIYKDLLITASIKTNSIEKVTYLTSILRSLLQLVVVTNFEIVRAKTPADEIDLFELTNRFCKPVDGLPVQIIDTLTPHLRRYINKQFFLGWFESSAHSEIPLSRQLQEWVTYRNNRPAHGVLDTELAEEWAKKTLSIIQTCMLVFKEAIPRIENDGKLQLAQSLNSLVITTPLLYKNSAIVILNITVRKGIWKLKGQQLSLEKSLEFTVDLTEDNIFSNKGLKPVGEYELVDVTINDKQFSFFHNIPVRQTDTFEGRKKEIGNLIDWINDEDSRYCLVYGDGGYGKTTLVLELLNQFIEGQFDVNEPLPTIISYHSAKMTKWTEDGLLHFTGVTPVMDECIRELIRCFYPTLTSDWYSITGRALIDKAVGVLKDNKLNRNDVLLVLDNTETLATTPSEVTDLGQFFKSVGKQIGRIIITSRRREFIEATPIVIEGLSEIEAINLMKRLADEYKATSIQQAGESKLRKVSNQLMCKPILLEALVKYVAVSALGVDSAIENIFKKSNEDLLEFLYEDAWKRMNVLQREIFFVIIHLSCPLDQNSISSACQEVGIQQTEFQSGLAETHFAILTDYGRSYSLELVDLAKRFFFQQFKKLDDAEKQKFITYAETVDKLSFQRQQTEKEYKTDRVAEAFRSEYAKSAKVYADKGDIQNSIEMYRLALEDDPLNSALHDRFSWLLLNRTQDFEYARKISEKAIILDPKNCDAIVGLALVYYRLGDVNTGDKYIDNAEKLGRSKSFCILRKAIARYHSSKTIENVNDAIILLEQALSMLLIAEKLNSKAGSYEAKNLKDINRYQELTAARLAAERKRKSIQDRLGLN